MEGEGGGKKARPYIGAVSSLIEIVALLHPGSMIAAAFSSAAGPVGYLLGLGVLFSLLC
jgi:hypothetical protein